MKAIIHLAPSSLLRQYFIIGEKDVESINTMFELGVYEKFPAIEVAPWTVAYQEAAEAMFDLTNDPNLQPEREQLYGRHRSVSVGDIIEVVPDNGVGHSFWLCMSVGWKELT